MAQEIEHKYLVKNQDYKNLAIDKIYIKQGYLSRDPERTVRVRLWDNDGYITIKGKNQGDSRAEYEYKIPYQDAEKLLELCVPPVIEKRRYIIPFGGHNWEVDEFLGALAPLVLAEIELSSSDEKYDLPDFIGENVTNDPRYYNSNLGKTRARSLNFWGRRGGYF